MIVMSLAKEGVASNVQYGAWMKSALGKNKEYVSLFNRVTEFSYYHQFLLPPSCHGKPHAACMSKVKKQFIL